MHIAFDAKRAFLNSSGLGNYARTLIKSLNTYHPENHYTLFTPRTAQNDFHKVISNQSTITIQEPEHFIDKKLRARWRSFGITPMLGFVVGNKDGVAPGVELDFTYSILDFYSETEYVFDFADSENNFLYTWSELAVSPLSSLRTGISAQRTRLYETELDFQRGIFAEYSFWKLTAGVHYFNPFSSDNFVILNLSIDF